MKKNKRHLYKRLPKYALGTMKPIDLGYQPGRGIGSARFETEQNMSLEPETQAIRRSYIPNAIGKVTQYSPYVTEAIKDWTPGSSAASTTPRTSAIKMGTSKISPMPSQPAASVPTSTVAPINIPGSTASSVASSTGSFASRLSNIAAPYIDAGALSQIASNTGSTASSVGNSLTNALSSTLTNGATSASNALLSSGAGTMANTVTQTGGQLLSASAQEAVNKAVEQSLQTSPTKSGALGIAGKVSAGLGAAIGAYNMYNDIAGFGDHRSASDMLANVGRSHVTTDYGNQYTTYNGVNAGQELAYEKANARAKQLGFGMNALGTGASIGSLILPGWGTAIGAAAGLLLGGLGSLFGWGDNSEEIERLTRLTNDNIANYNRQGEAVARSKDVAAEFNDRQGVATAAEGKNAFGPMTSKKGDNINTPRFVFDISKPNNIGVDIPSSKLMPGETVLNKETSNWAVVPGKGDKDNVYSTVRPGDPNVVYTKKGGISKKAQAVLKSNASDNLKRWQLNELEKEQSALQMAENNQTEMKKYKNGKLPGYWRGTDYLMSAIPHLAAMGTSWNQYNRAKYADTHAPSTYVNNAAGAQALNELAQLRFDPTQYLTDARRAYNQANFQANRMAGLGAGGQAILRNTNYQNYLDSLGKIRIAQQDADNKYRAAHANALAEYGAREQEALINDNIRRFQWQQQQNAAKEGWMAQYEKNGLTALADLASDIMGVRQFNRSEDYGNRMLKLYDQQVENDKVNAQAALANAMQARLDREAAYNKTAKEAVEKTHPMFLNQGIFRPDGLWNAYGDPAFSHKLTYPQIDQKYAKYFKPVGYEDGKGSGIDYYPRPYNDDFYPMYQHQPSLPEEVADYLFGSPIVPNPYAKSLPEVIADKTSNLFSGNQKKIQRGPYKGGGKQQKEASGREKQAFIRKLSSKRDYYSKYLK